MDTFTQIDEQMLSKEWLDGQHVKLVHLKNKNGMTASFMDVGATWLSCTVPVNGEQREVLLRAKNMQAHLEQTAFLGAVVGRYGNRIAKGKFELNGKPYSLTINNGENSLHGGVDGFDKRRWIIESYSQHAVCFELISEDGDQGYPGNLAVKVTYTLTDDNQVEIDYWAHCDQDCPVNLTNHAYFNLAGEDSAVCGLKQNLQLAANHIVPIGADLIPTGEWTEVADTCFDFRTSKPIQQDFIVGRQQALASGYDHAFVFDKALFNESNTAVEVGRLEAEDQSLAMVIKTTKPAIQFYSGNFLEGIDGLSGTYANHAGVALETQYLPDGPNQLQWEYGYELLKAGDIYQHKTCYQFV
ncbi:MAG: galactose-1-epimerase [Vibrio sp.]